MNGYKVGDKVRLIPKRIREFNRLYSMDTKGPGFVHTIIDIGEEVALTTMPENQMHHHYYRDFIPYRKQTIIIEA